MTDTQTFEIAVLGGDGIGPEVCREAVRLLNQIEQMLDGVAFGFNEYSVGVGEYQRGGNALPDEAFDACR